MLLSAAMSMTEVMVWTVGVELFLRMAFLGTTFGEDGEKPRALIATTGVLDLVWRCGRRGRRIDKVDREDGEDEEEEDADEEEVEWQREERAKGFIIVSQARNRRGLD